MAKIRHRIRELAEAKGWNQTKLMHRAEINNNTAADAWKDPYHNFRYDVLRKIAKALEVSVDELFLEEEPED